MGLLDGKVTLITGSTRGIGRAMAERFAEEGATVVVHGRDPEVVAKTAEGIRGAVGLAAEVDDRAAAAGLIGRTVEACGKVDVVVNNAAVSERTAITRVTDEEWDRLLAINLTAPMAICREAVRAMKAQGGGNIINVISGAGESGTPGFATYAATKGGLLALTLTLARELKPFNIRANCLSPAALTDMLKQLPPELLEPMVKAGLPTVEQVANVALFLASDLSATMSGHVLHTGGA